MLTQSAVTNGIKLKKNKSAKSKKRKKHSTKKRTEIMSNNLFLFGKRTKSPKAIGAFLIIFGTVYIIVSSAIYVKDEVFKKNAIKTTGVVVENVKSENGQNFRTRYSYIDEAGNEHFTTGSSSSNKIEYEVGTIIPVYYSKAKPEKSIYESPTVKFVIKLFFFIGFLVIVIGLILYIKNKDKPVVWEKIGFSGKSKKSDYEDE